MADFDKAIAPGQEGKITLKLNTSRRQGKLTKTAAVTSNDPNMPNTTITLSCFVKEFISIKPSARINIVGYEGDKLSQKLTITATEGFEQAMVTRGGVSLKEVYPDTLESRLVKRLFFAGEVLDLDGPTGGFNLQWAFSSGFLAGLSAAGLA